MAANITPQQLNPNSLPPGTPPAFKDWLIRLNQISALAGRNAGEATENATDALKVANEQKTRNDQQDNTLNQQAGQISQLATEIDGLSGSIVSLDVNSVKLNKNTLQVMDGPLSIGTEIRVNNVKVMGGRQLGWTAASGTLKKGGINGSAAYTAGAAYSQAEIQALADGLVEARQVIAALVALVMSHGLAGVDPTP